MLRFFDCQRMQQVALEAVSKLHSPAKTMSVVQNYWCPTSVEHKNGPTEKLHRGSANSIERDVAWSNVWNQGKAWILDMLHWKKTVRSCKQRGAYSSWLPDDLCSAKHKPHTKLSCTVLGYIKCFGQGNSKRAIPFLTSAIYLLPWQI